MDDQNNKDFKQQVELSGKFAVGFVLRPAALVGALRAWGWRFGWSRGFG